MKNDLKSLPFQIDFKTNHIPIDKVMSFIQENSIRVQHLLDNEPRISRWWFEDLSKASKAIIKIEESGIDVDYKLVAADIDAVFIQKGEF